MFCIRLLVFAQDEQAINKEQIALIGYVIFAVLLLSVMVILFFMTFQKRKNKLLLDQIEQQKAFDEEISRTQTEIQEQTLKHISWELHDNVGQLLAYANMQLNMISAKVPEDIKDKVTETTQIVKDSLTEVRALSKSLNNDVLLNMGLEASILNELNRLKRMQFATAELSVVGEKQDFRDKKHEIIIFRILQEFLSNSVKYSEAHNLNVELNYSEDQLVITASDDGIGFDVATAEKGSGLINMKNRAELIGATFDIKSEPQNGVTLIVNYPL
ncbi:sensor histidine kinase [Psychroserpens sp. SPM9]|uniref:sensor histidine kinase n=1 Tax=Psychroserpens sp. SPM9 TaxID=2975598 RepID=UPI0021A929E2|nr:sensor histidine kinase [Psychroserpens sp. SPM9]MDG5491819.1 sensor histidine kinase [Psychroserpens sp. SPM9]